MSLERRFDQALATLATGKKASDLLSSVSPQQQGGSRFCCSLSIDGIATATNHSNMESALGLKLAAMPRNPRCPATQ
jgi:hypothetical protein